MSESELFDDSTELVETEEGFVLPQPSDDSKLDSEIDFDDEEYRNEDEELLSEAEVGSAEGEPRRPPRRSREDRRRRPALTADERSPQASCSDGLALARRS